MRAWTHRERKKGVLGGSLAAFWAAVPLLRARVQELASIAYAAAGMQSEPEARCTTPSQVVRKADLIRKNMVQSVSNERNILAQANNPFVVRFYYSFTSVDNLYIVMEYVSGGDVYSLLRTMGALDEAIARVYIAETILALEYCHTQVRDFVRTLRAHWLMPPQPASHLCCVAPIPNSHH